MAKKSTARKAKEVLLIANGDLRLSANQNCWAAQQKMEQALTQAVKDVSGGKYKIKRAHPYDKNEKHGFISSQKQGMDIFKKIDPKAPLIVAEAVWQYSHHVLHGLITHQGPILTVANWSGTWPGLVGMLNLNGSLTKAGVKYGTLWSNDFTDKYFTSRLLKWLTTGKCTHPKSHVKALPKVKVPTKASSTGNKLAAELIKDKAIMGIFDEGCMGMFNAIIPDHLLNPTGVYKERLSQSALFYEASTVSNKEAKEIRAWYKKKGMTFHTGKNHKTDLTEEQILKQCKMYIAAVRIADDFGCDTIGIQYQQGLKDLMPASDLVEGTLNNTDRPPVKSRDGKRVLYRGQAIPHFNEVDECAGLDGLMTFRVHKALGQPVENTLHDLRWGDYDASGTVDDYVWVFLISGSAPPAHHIGGWKGTDGLRQPAMYFPNGGSTVRGIAKPGEIVWSRIYVQNGKLNMDLGRGGVVKLPKKETERRWNETTVEWPIMHAVTYGVSRDQMMAQHQANHIQCAYAKDEKAADLTMLTKATMAKAMGMKVNICGTKKNGSAW
ncbi:fucose isomerase [Poriferisphaera sp. WC338]|uniref:fucose isomerase n=1 Tax=Poriferisphaera sp. WC338 TaxID=3425129 RepID=UPI003D817859